MLYLHQYDIFGDTFLEGLVDSLSAVEFEKNLDALHDVWNSREEQFHSPPQLFDYFRQYKATVFKESMIKPIRMKSWIG